MIGKKFSDGLVISLSIDEVIDLSVFFSCYLYNFLDLMGCLSDVRKDAFKGCEDTICSFSDILSSRISDVE